MGEELSNTLDNIFDRHPEYAEESGFEYKLLKYKTEEVLTYATGERALDLGCGVGILTERISSRFRLVVGVDGSIQKITIARRLHKPDNVTYTHALLDDYRPDATFDTIIMTNVVEHVKTPPDFLRKIRGWINPYGKIIATVPHALAFHKQLGKAMGLIDDYYALTSADLTKGHTIVYDRATLTRHFEQAGYRIESCHGFFFKPFSSAQMERYDDNILDGLYAIGRQYPDLCSSLIIVGVALPEGREREQQ